MTQTYRRSKVLFEKKMKEFQDKNPDHTIKQLADFANTMGYYLQINFIPFAAPGEVFPILGVDKND